MEIDLKKEPGIEQELAFHVTIIEVNLHQIYFYVMIIEFNLHQIYWVRIPNAFTLRYQSDYEPTTELYSIFVIRQMA